MNKWNEDKKSAWVDVEIENGCDREESTKGKDGKEKRNG